jgi:hypothetical protein
MTKKIFTTTGIILLVGLALLAAGCSKGGLQPAQTYQSLAPPSQFISQSSPTGTQAATAVNSNSSTAMIQSGLPLTVSQPSDGATLLTDSVLVAGKTAPGAVVGVNEQTGTADANGNFSISVSLDSGLNAIDVIATDNNGNQGEIVLLENVEAAAGGAGASSAEAGARMSLKVNVPADGATLNSLEVTVSGSTAPDALVNVDDITGTADGTGNFSLPVTLETGLNALDVTAADVNGNEAEVILMVNVN